MIEIGSRARTQPPPLHIVYASLRRPNVDGTRTWLTLLDDEKWPGIRDEDPPHTLTWTSLWPRRADALIRFDLASAMGETSLRWTLLVEAPVPDDSLTGHLRKRVNQLINHDLRHSYGQ